MEWRSTKEALSDLEKLLMCGICEDFLVDPCTLENCDHNFCRKCIEKKLGSDSKCPDCGVFSWLKDIRLNHELSTTVKMMIKLRALIGANEIEKNTRTSSIRENKKNSLQPFPKPTTPAPSSKILQKQKKEVLNEKGNNGTLGGVSAKKQLTVCEAKTNEPANKYPLRKDVKRPAYWVDNVTRKNRVTSNVSVEKQVVRHEDKNSEPAKKYPLRRNLKRPAYLMNGVSDATNENGTTPKKSRLTGEEIRNEMLGINTKQVASSESPPRKSSKTSDGISPFTCLRPRPNNSGLKDKTNQKQRNDEATPDKTATKKLDNETKIAAYEKENIMLNVKRKRMKPRGIQKYFTEIKRRDYFSDEILHSSPQRSQTKPSTNASPSQELRNKRGETPLHLAAIKGDVSVSLNLLKEGANPNTKDHAGWTPLHEACNHGHVDVVELFLDHGALINIPGFDNDTPLHDAVANGRLNVVRLLIKKGASLTARNKQGLIPMDYATTQAMKDALSSVVTAKKRTKIKSSNEIDYVKLDDNSSLPKVLIATGLNKSEKELMGKCVSRLGGTLLEEFSDAVTHVVTSANENGVCPRTMKYFSGVLSGKWIASINWISNCLKSEKWLNEELYEVQGSNGKSSNGPKKARNNMAQQLPPLFEGCSFYFRGSFNPPTPDKSDLINLVKLGGGNVLHREPKIKDDDLMSLPSTMIVTSLTGSPQVAYHARVNSSLSCCTQFIIYEATSCNNHKVICSPVLRTAPVTWLMDCMSSFELLDIPDESCAV